MKHFVLTATVLSLISSPIKAQTKNQPNLETVGRVVRLLEDSGYRYTKLSPLVWSITFEGDKMPSVPVLVIADDQQLVIEGVIAQHDDVASALDAMRQLLKMNAAVGSATLLIDKDEDFVARARFILKQLDGHSFKSSIQSVAMATDEAYGAVRPYLSSGGGKRTANPTSSYEIPSGATQRIEVLNGKASISFNPSKWRESQSGEPGRLTFEHSKGDGYAMVISERIQIPTDRLRDIALANAREAAPDAKVVEEQERLVNGSGVLLMRIEGNLKGVPFTYLGYYYAGAAGTVQVLTYTGQNLFDEYRKDFEEFLNGFRVRQ